MTTMQALTLTCPWAHAIAYWGKNIENRTWVPPRHLFGQRIAIHAGKSPYRQRADGSWTMSDAAEEEVGDAMDFIADARVGDVQPVSHRWLHERSSAVLAVATVAGWVGETPGSWSANGREKADLDAVNAARAARSPWFVGPVGWVLRDVVAIEPVPCRGAQGLWRLPADVDAIVRSRVEAARCAA